MFRVLGIGSCFVAMVMWSSSMSTTWKESDLTTLGHHLFFSKALSSSSNISCASCHVPQKEFTDGYRTSQNAYGDRLALNAPSLLNLNDNLSFGWFAPGRTIENQIQQPLLAVNPVENGYDPHGFDPVEELTKDRQLTHHFSNAQLNIIDQSTIESALILYIESLVSHDSEFDKRIVKGQEMTTGEEVFFCDLQCHSCHGGIDLDRPHQDSLHGIWNSGSKRRIRVPGLRNVALTKPFFHDGSCTSLREAIHMHYSDEGLSLPIDQMPDPHQMVALIGFLESLTDTTFLTSKRFRTPYGDQ